MNNIIRTVPAILAALFAATATLTANAASWTGGQTGVDNTESSPYNIMDTANWDGPIGSGTHEYLTVLEKTYIWSKGNPRIGNDFCPNSGDFVFMGSLTFQALKAGAASKTVSITKKNGDWTIQTYNFVLGNGNYSTVLFTNESGNVTCTGTGDDQFFISWAESSKGELVNLDGTLSFAGNLNFGRWSKNTATLTVDGGTVTVNSGHCVQFRSGSGTINLNGGTLTTKQVKTNGGTGTINFNGGTLKANAVADDGLIKSGVTVNVGAGGGTIDCNGNDITIRAALGQSSDTGGMTFTGGNGNTISFDTEASIRYKGITTITPGTRLAHYHLGNSKNVISNGIVVAGMPAQGDVIFTCTRGGGYTLAGVDVASHVTCPIAPDTTFALDEGNTNIVVTSVGVSLAPAFWTGAAKDGDLSNPANWTDNAVPGPGTNATILCATPATLTKGNSFAPASITFAEGCAAVTIDGEDLNNIVAITNNSSASHTINAKVYFAGDIQVKQAAMGDAANLSKAHVTFAGGAYAASTTSPIHRRAVGLRSIRAAACASASRTAPISMSRMRG